MSKVTVRLAGDGPEIMKLHEEIIIIAKSVKKSKLVRLSLVMNINIDLHGVNQFDTTATTTTTTSH